MTIIDLSHYIKKDMMLFPGDPEINISEGLTHEKDYCHVDMIHMNTHTGTHIDAPLHFIKSGKSITDYPADKFICKGAVLDLTYKKPGEAITPEDLKRIEIKPGTCIVLAAGWYKYFGHKEYLNHPYLSKTGAEYLVAEGVSIVAVDFLNVDPTLHEAWDAHPVLLGNDILIVENINNSLSLDFNKEYIFSFLPLKIAGTDGSPVRGVAIDMDILGDLI